MQLLLSGMVQTGETSPAWCITLVCNSKELNPSSFAVANFLLWIAGKIKRKGEEMRACSKYCHIWCLQPCPKHSFQNALCAMHVGHQWVFLSISCDVSCLTHGFSNQPKGNKNKPFYLFKFYCCSCWHCSKKEWKWMCSSVQTSCQRNLTDYPQVQLLD